MKSNKLTRPAHQFQVGNPGGGRTKGSLNRTTTEMKAVMQLVVDENLAKLEADLSAMQPFQRWQILLKLTKFFMPELSAGEMNVNPGKIEFVVSYNKTPEPVQLKNQDVLDITPEPEKEPPLSLPF